MDGDVATLLAAWFVDNVTFGIYLAIPFAVFMGIWWCIKGLRGT